MPTLLKLPRELRDMIYRYYFHVDGGYICNFVSNKLRQADNSLVELNLIYVCRQIARETCELALCINPVQFATFHSDAIQMPDALLNANHRTIDSRKVALVSELAPALLSSEDTQISKKAYPQFSPIIDGWRLHGRFGLLGKRYVDCGEAPSLWHDFIAFILDLLSQHPEFAEKAEEKSRFWRTDEGNHAFDLSNACPKPWDIMDTVETERLAKTVTGISYGIPHYVPSTKYPYSAAQVALRFLKSVPKSTCKMIRKIILVEDRESVARPACHGRGFITFCQTHPQLKIERSVSLWAALFPVARISIGLYQYALQRCPADRMTKAVGMWVVEALLLQSLGMPKDSFTLILDGTPTPDHTSRVLRSVIQRDVAWQTALDISYIRGLLPKPTWLDRRLRTGYMYEGLPTAIHKLSKEGSLIRTNFDFDMPHFDVNSPSQDVERLLDEHRGWTVRDWERGWATHEPAGYQNEAPLSPGHIIWWQGVVGQM